MEALKYENIAGKMYLCFDNESGRSIDHVTAEMLDNNEIEGLVSCSVRREDLLVQYRYDVSGLTPLRTVFMGPISRARLFAFLAALDQAVKTCSEYLIPQERLQVGLDFIFYDTYNKRYRFIVIPFADGDTSLNRDLKMIIDSIEPERNEDRAYYGELNSYFWTYQEYDPAAMRRLLEKYGPRMPRAAQGAANRPKPAGARSISRQEARPAPVPVPVTPAPVQQEEEKEEGKGGIFKGIFGKKGKTEDSAGERKPSEAVTGPSAGGMPKVSSFGGFAIPGTERPVSAQKEASPAPVQQARIKAQDVDLQMYKPQDLDIEKTTYYSEAAKEESTQRVPYPDDEERTQYAFQFRLSRISTGEGYDISKPVTKIGRKNEIVDIYVSNNIHIGRIHAIFTIEDGSIYIDDNASSNGTFVNDVRITGKTELNIGDRIRLADEEFVLE